MNVGLQRSISSVIGGLVLLIGVGYLSVDLYHYAQNPADEVEIHYMQQAAVFVIGIVLLRAKDEWFSAIGKVIAKKLGFAYTNS